MRKILLVSMFLIILSGCTLPWQQETLTIPVEHNFKNDYERHVQAVFDRWQKTRDEWFEFSEKFSPSGYDNSMIRFATAVAETGSGEIKIKADAVRNIRDMTMSADIDATGFFSAKDSIVRLDRLRGSFVNAFITYYLKLDEFKISGSGEGYTKVQEEYDEFMKRITPHLGKWFAYDSLGALKVTSLNSTQQERILQTNVSMLLGLYMDILAGGEKIEKMLMEDSILQPTADLGKEGEYYRYAVTIDHTGAYNLIERLSQTFAGTGIADTGTLEQGLQNVFLSGVLSIHESKSEYFKFDGILGYSGSREQSHVDMAFTPTNSHLKLSALTGSTETELFVYQSSLTDTTGKYTLTASGQRVLEGSTTRDSKGLTSLVLDAVQAGEGVRIKYDFTNRKDFTLVITTVQKGVEQKTFDISGAIRGDILAKLHMVITPEKGQEAWLDYSYAENGNIEGKIGGSGMPSTLDLTGHYKKDDINLTATFQGMTTTLTHKKQSDGIFDGSLRLPVATMNWKGKENKEFLESLVVNIVSPAGAASLDMQTVDGWLTGPIKIIQNGKTLLEAALKAKRSGKDFSWRVDVPQSTTVPHAIHLEWDSHIDIRWDKNAKVQIPKDTLSIFDAFPELGEALRPKTSTTITNTQIGTDNVSLPTPFQSR